jgi:hypothetical protein
MIRREEEVYRIRRAEEEKARRDYKPPSWSDSELDEIRARRAKGPPSGDPAWDKNHYELERLEAKIARGLWNSDAGGGSGTS